MYTAPIEFCTPFVPFILSCRENKVNPCVVISFILFFKIELSITKLDLEFFMYFYFHIGSMLLNIFRCGKMFTRGGSKQKRKVDGCTPEKYRENLCGKDINHTHFRKKVVLQQQKNKTHFDCWLNQKNAFQQKKYAKSAKKGTRLLTLFQYQETNVKFGGFF